MILLKDAIKIQRILIEEFGGISSVRDLGALESAFDSKINESGNLSWTNKSVPIKMYHMVGSFN